jgi:hypothetical protein
MNLPAVLIMLSSGKSYRVGISPKAQTCNTN